ncbi:unnamed protein product, partial [Oikopleura dioica]
ISKRSSKNSAGVSAKDKGKKKLGSGLVPALRGGSEARTQ